MHTPGSSTLDVEIIEFSEETKEAIKTLNVEWLKKYFRVEPIDIIQLSDPLGEIIEKGGLIFYAKHKEEIVGTFCLLRVEDHIYELAKMAVTESAQGLGIGTILMDHCMLLAKQNQIRTLILYSNTRLSSAIHLYRKYGFAEIPLEPGHYDRANIKMEKHFK